MSTINEMNSSSTIADEVEADSAQRASRSMSANGTPPSSRRRSIQTKFGLEYLHRPTREWLGLLILALGLKQEGEVVVAECNGGMILAENPLVDLDSPTKERLGLLILAWS
jgi:hypothetical protein